MGKLILVRHGQTEMNAKKIYYGRLNPPLNDFGMEQIKNTREILAQSISYDKIYASPLLRAKQTAEICNYLDLPINYSENLRELDFGIFEGLKYKEICEKYPEEMKKAETEWETFNYITGESPIQMYERVVKFLKTLDLKKNNLIVAHWGTLNCILSHFLTKNLDGYWKYKFENGGIAILEGDIDFCYLTKFI